ncbi:hypothetical protein [Alkalicoccus saliphilus]|uniref:Uncharacterized protein n=1 Tax=Alkalicoccus saliphilus TaxID=200989 RepID=A0A2T4U6S3_9BACI|nr:hypothetical protein [Alkalicoccus saliphilus]PTL39102.1 hypothetical protein C6Y45_07950 [Alkalicoccus saliphilus]
MKNISEVIIHVERWIKSLEVPEQNRALCELGLLFIESIHKKEMLLTVEKADDVHKILKSPIDLINYNREEIIELAQQVGNSNVETWNVDREEINNWNQFLGGIALSYASKGDLSVVASLIRISAELNLHGRWIVEATDFLLDQQQPEGYFGLYFKETSILNKDQEVIFLLRLTVDILWALAVQNRKLIK